jgi:hypothetical protein
MQFAVLVKQVEEIKTDLRVCRLRQTPALRSIVVEFIKKATSVPSGFRTRVHDEK